MKQLDIKKSISNEKGLTLIDVAIALIVIGLLITPALYSLREYKRTQAQDKTETNLGAIDQAIREYFIANDFYPCPADPTLPRTSDQYGEPAFAGAGSNCAFNTGSVPFEELSLDVELIFDGYGNKITYSVTNGMAGSVANPPLFPLSAGAISVESVNSINRPGDCASVCANTVMPFPAPGTPNLCTADPADFYPATAVETTTNIHYTLFSSGQDGVGAFNENGIQASACVAGGSRDDENCDGDLTFTADVNNCLYTEVTTNQRFDDIHIATALEKNVNPTNTFERSTATANAMGTSVNYTGVNNNDPQHELDVAGNIRVTDVDMISGDDKKAAAHAQDFCDTNGTVCFESGLIGGRDPRMQCGIHGMAGIGSNRADCPNRVNDTTTANTSCTATARKITSITIGGTYECAP